MLTQTTRSFIAGFFYVVMWRNMQEWVNHARMNKFLIKIRISKVKESYILGYGMKNARGTMS